MFGYDDSDLNSIILEKLEDERVYVQMSLDKTQSKGIHERQLLETWKHELAGNSIAIGHSSKGAISHIKIVIIDGVYTVRGSTNWSLGGEQDQDNELTIHYGAQHLPMYDFLARNYAVCDAWHSSVLGDTWPNRLCALAGRKLIPPQSHFSFARFLRPCRQIQNDRITREGILDAST
jgi:phosphatidylserine/phosphatidylglycerophosphate/cardiolipin synthase-like enzyme